jgi:hypothetical protein
MQAASAYTLCILLPLRLACTLVAEVQRWPLPHNIILQGSSQVTLALGYNGDDA